jgi:hypothetical protein
MTTVELPSVVEGLRSLLAGWPERPKWPVPPQVDRIHPVTAILELSAAS